jgi:hypothetical protein
MALITFLIKNVNSWCNFIIARNRFAYPELIYIAIKSN